jgi:hypothetical protein
VVARQDPDRDFEPVEGLADDRESLRRPVIGIVTWQYREIDRACEMPVGAVDQGQEVMVVLLAGTRDVQVAEMNPAHDRVCRSHVPSSFVGHRTGDAANPRRPVPPFLRQAASGR